MEITLAELHDFHLNERVIFTRLIYLLSRNPCEALLAIAFWLWLEDDNDFENICSMLTQVSNNALESMTKEALFCVNSLGAYYTSPISPPFWITASVTGRSIPWRKMHENKETTVRAMKYLVEHVCALIFTDVLYRNYLEESDGGEEVGYYEDIPVTGFPHPVVGNVRFMRMHPGQMFCTDNLWGWNW